MTLSNWYLHSVVNPKDEWVNLSGRLVAISMSHPDILNEIYAHMDQISSDTEEVWKDLHERLKDWYDHTVVSTDLVAEKAEKAAKALDDVTDAVVDVFDEAAESWRNLEIKDTFDDINGVMHDVYDEAAKSWTDMLSWSAACENGA